MSHSLKGLLISTDLLQLFPGATSERESYLTHDKQFELTCFLRGELSWVHYSVAVVPVHKDYN